VDNGGETLIFVVDLTPGLDSVSSLNSLLSRHIRFFVSREEEREDI
jgi:hypothetical protein